MYFCGRYQVLSPLEAPEHMSDTNLMLRAFDMHNGGVEVLIKLMRDEGEYRRELAHREGLDSTFVVPILNASTAPELSQRWGPEAASKLRRKGYPYGLVMPAAQRNLLSGGCLEPRSTSERKQTLASNAQGTRARE